MEAWIDTRPIVWAMEREIARAKQDMENRLVQLYNLGLRSDDLSIGVRAMHGRSVGVHVEVSINVCP